MTLWSAIGRWLLYVVLALGLLTACGDAEPPANPTPPALAKQLVFHGWADSLPRSVTEAFTKEYGVDVIHQTYSTPEEAAETIRAGRGYDVAVVDHDFVPGLAAEHWLAIIDFRNIPNFRNISANFRDLATDPGNQHTVPFQYGTSGLLVRTDLIGHAVTRWADLWDPRYTGRVALRDQPREIVALTLLALGCSLNSENPQELDRALDRLLELKQSIVLVGAETDNAVPKLLSGEVVVLHGWESDYKTAHEANPAVSYVSPQEGTALWGDNFVINAKSPRQRTAEVFLNFLLRPDIGAEIVNETGNANANDAARPFVRPEIRDDPVIFPPADRLRRAYFYTPLSPDGESLYRRVWEHFLAGGRGVGE